MNGSPFDFLSTKGRLSGSVTGEFEVGLSLWSRRSSSAAAALIYTTNGIESLSARFRQATTRRRGHFPNDGHFPNEQSASKILCLTLRERRPNRSNPTGQINGWKFIRM